jgi:hypothetical protein
MPFRLLLITLVLLLGGCATMRNYDRQVYPTLEQASAGNVDAAIRMLDANNRTGKDLLYYMELGMLERLGERYPQSQKSWTTASERIEAENPLDAVGRAASFLVGDQLRAYQAHDYERVLLLTYMALNQLAIGDFESARVAIKQTHELEAIIAEQRAKQMSQVEEQAKKKGAHKSFKELDGYPVETIDNVAVNALKNSYQSAMAHYLAGFIYEALGEPSLAAPGYRLANELQPNQPLLEEGLRGLDQRVSRAQAGDDGMTDALFVISTGTAPALRSQNFRMPLFVQGRMVFAAISAPVMVPTEYGPPPTRITFDGGASFPVAPLTSIDLMARRSLKDDMPAIMVRGSIRATANAALQYQGQRAMSDGGNRSGVVGLAIFAAGAGAALLSHADDRTWRTLPSQISVARARLPRGAHNVTFMMYDGRQRSARVDVYGRYQVIDLRVLRNRVFVQTPKAPTSTAQTKEVLE